MKNEIVKINASDYGLEESKASEIKAMFLPMLEKMEELENQYNEILKQEINPETCQAAKDLRLSYVKVRTGTAEIHKNLKIFYLNGGRFVDAFKNTQAFASGEKEKTLKNIEDFFENQKRERIEKLRIDRFALIKPYTEIEPLGLGYMEQVVFDNLLQGFKIAYEIKIAAEKKAEEDHIAKEKADAEEREKQRLENIRLKIEIEERKRIAEIERKKNDRIIAAQKAKAEAERKERKHLEAEIEARKQADEKAKREAEAKIEAEKRKRLIEEKKAKLIPDKKKLMNFCKLINDLPRPEVKSIEAADIASKANILLVKVVNFIKENTNKL